MFSFCMFINRDAVEVHNHEENPRPISDYLDLTSKGFIICHQVHHFSFRTQLARELQ